MTNRMIAMFCLLLIGATGCRKEETSIAASGIAALDQAALPSRGDGGTAKILEASGPVSAPQRMVVYTADLRLIVEDTAAAVKSIQAVVLGAGGYLGESRIWREGELLRASMTLRIPSEQLGKALEQIRSQGKRVENENLSSNDAGSEYVDLQSRLRNLRATETELLSLLTTIRERSRKAAEVLEIHQQLTTIRGEIEQIEGRVLYLQQTVAMATLRVELIPDGVGTPVMVGGWEPAATFRKASRALVLLVQRAADVSIWVVIYVLPAAVLLIAPIVLLIMGTRRLRGQRLRVQG